MPEKNQPQREYRTLDRPWYRALATRVLAVAVPGEIGDWAAYIDAVPGRDHSEEYKEVMHHGCKMDKRIAATLFDSLDPEKYRL